MVSVVLLKTHSCEIALSCESEERTWYLNSNSQCYLTKPFPNFHIPVSAAVFGRKPGVNDWLVFDHNFEKCIKKAYRCENNFVNKSMTNQIKKPIGCVAGDQCAVDDERAGQCSRREGSSSTNAVYFSDDRVVGRVQRRIHLQQHVSFLNFTGKYGLVIRQFHSAIVGRGTVMVDQFENQMIGRDKSYLSQAKISVYTGRPRSSKSNTSSPMCNSCMVFQRLRVFTSASLGKQPGISSPSSSGGCAVVGD
ncbi:hypothetical protein T11_8014 [Trichinella zimbabwensis]|uniref:Uncharacterized protein n=1 Tax=Trichinella zimbabwensis TaxID=268475 RepID=A0A0V1H664_9BILA|nr:hypothetical protein T11_8014 [Trichinella zimbabwensis]